ncbi:MAG: hypothetical protein IPK82_23455 [Polyangiaceae bacterium]|nr:hypothetical protein [Polyangiaceae bacterium]
MSEADPNFAPCAPSRDTGGDPDYQMPPAMLPGAATPPTPPARLTDTNQENSGAFNITHETPAASVPIEIVPRRGEGGEGVEGIHPSSFILHNSPQSLRIGQWRSNLLRADRDLAAAAKAAQRPVPTLNSTAALIGASPATLCRLRQEFGALDYDALTPERLAGKQQNSGRRSGWSYLLDDPIVCGKLKSNYAASLASASERTAHDRHTGDMVKACQHFAREPECPPALAHKLLRRKIPACFLRFLRGITPEMESVIRGPKDFLLNGPSGQRAKMIGLPNGRAAYLPAGWIIELDDMSVNQPYWVDFDGSLILSRQGLFARCVKGRWLGCELIARVRESYTSADILGFIQRLFELLGGLPRKLRIERSVWASLSIAGYKLNSTGDWSEEHVDRPEMDPENRLNLSLGLAALGIEVEFTHSARGKSDLEGSFHPLQAHLAQFTKDFPNIGRRRDEFNRMAKQLRRVRAGSHHPEQLGFPHQNVLAQRVQDAFDFINGTLPITEKATLHDILNGGAPVDTYDQLWQRDLQLCPLKPIPADADLAFLPVLRTPTIRGGAVLPRCDRIEYPFRALELAALGDGYATYVRFDPGDLSKPAAIYNREGKNPRNQRNYADGALICRAEFDAPGFTAHAFEVPEGLPQMDVSQIYGVGVVPDGGAMVKAQRAWVTKKVRTAFTGRLPGQPATRTATARDGRGNTATVGSSGASPHRDSGGASVPASRPVGGASVPASRAPQDSYAALFGG